MSAPAGGAPGTAGWDEAQDRTAVAAVRHGAGNSREIAGRLARAGVAPEGVKSVADLAAVPVLPKDDLPGLQAADPPFGGMLAVPAGSLRRIFRSPGPINDPQGDGEDFWGMSPAVRAAGLGGGDVVLNAFSYHLTPGGLMLDGALRAAGCTVIPGGVGDTASQIEIAVAAGATGYAGTPQFLLTILERARESGRELPLRRALVTGAPLPPALRARLRDEFGVDVLQAYGTADAGMLGHECRFRDGWHVPARVVIELLVPGSDRPAAAGEAGQVVVTSPNEVYPLVRFGTGDLSTWRREPCPCGLTGPRLAGFLGRVGEGVKVRGMFVHPGELAGVLAGDPRVGRHQAVVTGDAGGRDIFTVRIEAAPGVVLGEGEVAALGARIREAVKVRPVVEVVTAGEIAPDDAGAVVDGRPDGVAVIPVGALGP